MDLGKAQQGDFLSWDCSQMVAGAGAEGTGAAGKLLGISFSSGHPMWSLHMAQFRLPHSMAALGNQVTGYMVAQSSRAIFLASKQEHSL